MVVRGLLFVALALGNPVSASHAHPPAILNAPAERAVVEEIAAFRSEMAAAIARRDASRLREMYTRSFVHTSAGGALIEREARIAAVQAGKPVIEGLAAREVVIRIPNDWTAIATGLSTKPPDPPAIAVDVRWTIVYVRTQTGWAMAAGQATAAAGTTR